MACELPVLTNRVGYAKDIHRDIAALSPYIPPKSDVAMYWELLDSLAGNLSLAKELGLVGAEYVRRRNNMSSMISSYISLIEQVAQNKRVGKEP